MEGFGFVSGQFVGGRGLVRRGRGREVCGVRMTAPVPMTTGTSSSSSVEKEKFSDYVMNTYSRYDITMESGKGVKLYDIDGKEYFDFVSGIATCALGHANPRLVKAIAEQIGKLHHVSNLYYIPEQSELAKLLVNNSVADKVFFCNSGAEANEAAIKLARKYAATKRGIEDGVILSASQSFHGRTLATVTATGQPKYQKNFSPLVPGFDYITYNDTESLEAAFRKYGNRVIGVILEACQGEGGVKPGNADFFARVRELCDKGDAVMIMDEVQVGVGRTGKMWGFENLDVKPDVFTIAKGLGGGIPIGAMLCTKKMDVFVPGDHASTFGGNPLSCAAGLTILNTITEPGFLAGVSQRGDQLRAKLNQLASEHPEVITEVRGWGLLNGIELNPDCGLVSADFVRLASENGLLLVPAGPNVVRFVPPLVITETEMVEAMNIFETVMNKLVQ